MMTTGTAQRGNAGWEANPLSSRVLNTAGSIGTVRAVSIMPTKPSASRRLYGPIKRSTRSKLAGNFIKICYVFPLRHDEESSTLPFLRICGAGESIRLRRSMRQVQRDAFTRQSWAEPYDARPEDMPGEIIFHYNTRSPRLRRYIICFRSGLRDGIKTRCLPHFRFINAGISLSKQCFPSCCPLEQSRISQA